MMVTCRNCKKKIDKSKAYSEKPRMYFCDKECFDAYYKCDSGDMDKFLDYVWKLYDPEYQDTQKFLMIKKQAEHYHDKYGFKYKGMLLTAKWFIEVKEQYWHNEFGLGQILPDQYLQLKQFYEQQQQLKESLNNQSLETKEVEKRGRNTKIYKPLSLD